MKKQIAIFLLLIISTAAFAVQFDPYWFQSRTIIGCFTKETIPHIDGKLEFSIVDGIVHTGLETFDALAQEYEIEDLVQMHPYVKVPQWNDNGIYLQNHYRIMLSSDERIDEAVAALNKDKHLFYAELEAINRQKFVPNDPMLPQQYAHTRLQSFDAWDYVLGSRDVIVAITDSGVKWNHPDLRGNIWINPAEAPGMTINWDAGTITGGDGVDAGEGGGKKDDLVGWDFVGNDNNPIQNYATNDHGTHVAGCAAAVGDNSIGVVGTSPIASILVCKGAPDNSPSTGVQYAYDQVKYAGEIGAHIINASWGGPGSGTYPNSIVNYVTTLGSTVIAAAGNENLEHTSSYQDYPADCMNALNVAATNSSDIKASFSDYGAPIDICAPGDGILSTIVAGNSYSSYSGTSMASPVAAGVAALVKSMHPEMNSEDLRFRLIYTADPIDDLNPNYVGKLGSGRINAFTATMFDKIPNVQLEEYDIYEIQGDNDGIPNPGERIGLKVKLNNLMTGLGVLWQDAVGLSGKLRTNYPGVTVIDSVSTFGQDGYLFAGSDAWNQTDFTFNTISGLPSEPIPFQLYLTSNPSSDYPFRKTIPINVELSLVQKGWPIDAGGASGGSPILVDITGDGKKEIVFANQRSQLNIMRYNGTTQVSNFPISIPANVVGSIAMSNLQGNNTFGFAASLANNQIAAFNSAGDQLWSVPAGGNLRNGPVIATLTAANSPKVIALTQNGSLVVLNADGTYMNNFPASLSGSFLGPPAVADLNGDGNLEIIACSLSGALHAINPLTGQNIAGFPVTINGGSQNAITIANIDGDTHPEILVATSTTGYLYAINHDGSILFQKTIGQQIKSSPVVADVDNDGTKEIIIIAANGNLHILGANGADKPGSPIAIGQSVECTPVVARFDNSNLAGIIFGDSNGYLHSVRMDGTESPNFPISLGGNLKVSAALADIDRDGDLDIVIPNNTGIFVVDIKRPAQSIEWQCYMGSFNRSGNIYQSTPNVEELAPALATELKGAYPNPFNPSTTLSFSLKDKGEVSLDIYNQKGQKVRSLYSGSLEAGEHQLVWNGTDDGGRTMPSGLYYYRMKSGTYSSTRKMIMMK
ncbi:MAG: S8 family serine peptidase [Candidatus Cloacimonetes bacterium]|nr:S8 family serine peptidase [Candidatus Cloacimonadota bacterium]